MVGMVYFSLWKTIKANPDYYAQKNTLQNWEIKSSHDKHKPTDFCDHQASSMEVERILHIKGKDKHTQEATGKNELTRTVSKWGIGEWQPNRNSQTPELMDSFQ